ncbi:sporulation protein [Streptomyces sp. NPDC003860]
MEFLRRLLRREDFRPEDVLRVETTVDEASELRPGDKVTGTVRIRAGRKKGYARVRVSLVGETRRWTGRGYVGHLGRVQFPDDLPAVRLEPGVDRSFPFELTLPHRVNALHGEPLGTRIGVRAAARGWKGTYRTIPLAVEPDPLQARVLDAFQRLGFRRVSAHHVYTPDYPQSFVTYQEFVLVPPAGLTAALGRLVLIFGDAASPWSDADYQRMITLQPAVRLRTGHRPEGVRFPAPNAPPEDVDWEAELARRLAEYAIWRREQRRLHSREEERPARPGGRFLNRGREPGSDPVGTAVDPAPVRTTTPSAPATADEAALDAEAETEADALARCITDGELADDLRADFAVETTATAEEGEGDGATDGFDAASYGEGCTEDAPESGPAEGDDGWGDGDGDGDGDGGDGGD